MRVNPATIPFADGWKKGLPFTVCGGGSLPQNTAQAREALPQWCAKYALLTVNDAGAGDLRWREGMRWEVEYRAFDLIPRHPSVTYIDITQQTMPACDLILCRFVLNHIGINHTQLALARFREAGRYLAATQFDPERPRGCYNLRRWLGEPLEAVPDGGHEGCTLALWQLQ